MSRYCPACGKPCSQFGCVCGWEAPPRQCQDFCPPTWTAHWRDWHRGHDCHLDPANGTRVLRAKIATAEAELVKLREQLPADPAGATPPEPPQGESAHDSSSVKCLVCLRLEGERDHLRDEVHALTNAGVIECAVRNRSVSEYMDHWEGRTLKAEAALTDAQAQLAAMREALKAIKTLAGGPRGIRTPVCREIVAILAALSPDPIPEPSTPKDEDVDLPGSTASDGLQSPSPRRKD